MFTDTYMNSQDILLPKGENFGIVTEILQAAGLQVPVFAGKRLHRRGCS